jgi:Zn-dependent protease
MTPTKDGSFRLFCFKGIEVYLHWSWLVVAYIEIQMRRGRYESLLWNALEYVGLFVIVLLHEFGHSLACRQVGGSSDQIVLWPLGGVAYVRPPPRPGATLWSIAAGPLVNVVLVPILTALMLVTRGWDAPDTAHFVKTLWQINLGLLIFNMLPIYPLDGGQILQSLLWFWLGRGRSLLVASIIGFVGVAALAYIAIQWLGFSIWTAVMLGFIAMNCWQGFKVARSMMTVDRIPRRTGLKCPSCGAAPPVGNYWKCANCGASFDIHESGGQCPQCRQQFPEIPCLFCGKTQPRSSWT